MTPKLKRNISRIIPFSIIWVVTGCVFILVEIAAMGTASPDSETVISLNWSIFIFAMIAVAIVGFIVGAIEVIFVEKLFRRKSFTATLLYKFGIYALLMIVISTITYPIAASMEMGISFFDMKVWIRTINFLQSETLLSTLFQMACSISLCVIYAGISENLGHGVLVNFLTGRYHRPRQEERIFMFLDMKSSTRLAEKLGHNSYFNFLSEYYADLSDSIINYLGEVYQYIGDEVVITWIKEKGIRKNNCLRCFYSMKADLEKRKTYYMKHFGDVPTFKAGLHIGKVTVGEIGALKKEIFFTGDVLNATSRIQSLCNDYNVDILLSKKLTDQLEVSDEFEIKLLGTAELKGRSASMELVTIDRFH